MKTSRIENLWNTLGVLGVCVTVLPSCSSETSTALSNAADAEGSTAGVSESILRRRPPWSPASGGSVNTGGVAGNGAGGSGGAATGGTTAVGGTTSASGTTGTGGVGTTAGTNAPGGTTSTGGTNATGGTTSTGGTNAAGGTTSIGGTNATGGTTSIGGTNATGGTTSIGGTSATGGATNTGGLGNAGSLDSCGNGKGQLFPPSSIWNQPVDTATLDSESAAVIGYLQTNHTASARFQIDFSIKLLRTIATTTRQTFTPTSEFYSPDCDPAPIPVPVGGSIEGESGYTCASDGDCHLLVVDSASCRLYEMWRANIAGSSFQGGCQVIWDLTRLYPSNMRGDYCTSADAAGLPIAAHLFNADEIQSGTIEHAIRFILPNQFMRAGIYVHPATHSTGPTSGGATAPPYGVRLRLKASKDVSSLNAAARVVANALKKYGMILSDGGNVTFTAMADDYTAAKWLQVGLGAQDMKSLQWTDFEMVDGGQRYNWLSGDCQHVPITQ